MICFIFAVLLYAVTVLFAIMSYFYKYVTPADNAHKSLSSSASSSSMSSSSSMKKSPVNADIEAFSEKPPLSDTENDTMDVLEKKISAENGGNEAVAMSAVGVSELKEAAKNTYDNVAMDDSEIEDIQF